MKFDLPELPFNPSDLTGWLSAETLEYHHGRHHRGYVEKLNSLVKNTSMDELPLSELIIHTKGELFNNAAQVWNHNFYWNGLVGTNIDKNLQKFPDLGNLINRSFGSAEKLMQEYVGVAKSTFGSGWVWIVYNSSLGRLVIMETPNAVNPVSLNSESYIPLHCCDVWEHAYYIDYRNNRMAYLDGLIKHISWEAISTRYTRYAETREDRGMGVAS